MRLLLTSSCLLLLLAGTALAEEGTVIKTGPAPQVVNVPASPAPAKTGSTTITVEEDDAKEKPPAKAANRAGLELQSPEVFFQGMKEPPRVGEEVDFRIRMTLPVGYSMGLPESYVFPDAAGIIREKISLSRKLSEDGKEVTFELSIPFRVLGAGWIIIPPQQIPVETPDGGRLAYMSPKRKFHTGTHFATENAPLPSALEAMVALVQTNWLLIWGLIIAGVVLLTAGSTALYLRWRAKRRGALPPPPVPPHVAALARLASLEKGNLIEYGLLSPYYTELSETLREYIGGRWDFDSMDLTTTELRTKLKRVQMEGVRPEEIVSQLLDYDLVKFAKAEPGAERARKDLDWVRGLVNRTMPPKETAPATGGAAK